MGDVRHINPAQGDLVEVLEKALEGARSGEVCGFILICQHDDGVHTADWPGEFSTDMDEIAQLVGHLSLATNYFSMFALMDEDYE